MLFYKSEEFVSKTSKTYRLINLVFPVTIKWREKFFIRKNGVRLATPLFVALIVIELTDVFFAIDSAPAILTIMVDPFIVISSDILAVMGLRSMFFLIAGMLDKFRYINCSLVAILALLGLKMLFTHIMFFPNGFP